MSGAKRDYERLLSEDLGYLSLAKQRWKEDTEALDQDAHYQQQQEEEAQEQHDR